MSAWQLLPLLWALFSRHPEMIDLEAYHLAWILFALGYTNALEDKGEIAAAAAVARISTSSMRTTAPSSSPCDGTTREGCGSLEMASPSMALCSRG